MRTYRLTPEAECDFRSAVRWYRKVRSDLARRFAQAVRMELDRIVASPEYWPVECGDTRRAVLDPWPYSIFYRVQRGMIRVTSVFHNSRDPQEWMDRT
jgi:plasmid stabilization system protein ParE